MTEKMKNTEARKIHWIAFTASLIGAPLLIAACILGPPYLLDLVFDGADVRGFFAVMPVMIVIGASLYFVIGTPVLIWHLRRHAPQASRIMMLSLASLLWLIPLGGLLVLVTFDPAALYFAAISMCFGVFGAPPLAIVFTLLYKRFAPA